MRSIFFYLFEHAMKQALSELCHMEKEPGEDQVAMPINECEITSMLIEH